MNLTDIQQLIWIDLEMTGLDPQADYILEIATIITDTQLKIMHKGPAIAIFQEEQILHNMNEWSLYQHEHSGLTERVRASNISLAEAEVRTLAFLDSCEVKPGTSPMCGNSVHQDRMFLRQHMPKLAHYFNYRNLDVSSFKIASHLWNPEIRESIKKQEQHTALADILESIEEMRVYKKNFLITR